MNDRQGRIGNDVIGTSILVVAGIALAIAAIAGKDTKRIEERLTAIEGRLTTREATTETELDAVHGELRHAIAGLNGHARLSRQERRTAEVGADTRRRTLAQASPRPSSNTTGGSAAKRPNSRPVP